MRPAQQFNDHRSDPVCPGPLKINKDSHFIRKSSSSSSSSSSSAASSLGIFIGTGGTPSKPPQHRQPVIIYTHSPKVIHTHPKDFMALVQKLTGLSRSEEDHHQSSSRTKSENRNSAAAAEDESNRISKIGDEDHDNDSSSVITDESSFLSPILDPPPGGANFLANMPILPPNSADFMCANQQLYNCGDPFYLMQNMRSSISSSSSGFDAINEFQDY